MLFHGMQKLIFKLPVGSWRFLGNSQNLHEHRELTIYPNRLSFYFFVPKFLVGENYSSAEHLSMELNPTKVWLAIMHRHNIYRHGLSTLSN